MLDTAMCEQQGCFQVASFSSIHVGGIGLCLQSLLQSVTEQVETCVVLVSLRSTSAHPSLSSSAADLQGVSVCSGTRARQVSAAPLRHQQPCCANRVSHREDFTRLDLTVRCFGTHGCDGDR